MFIRISYNKRASSLLNESPMHPGGSKKSMFVILAKITYYLMFPHQINFPLISIDRWPLTLPVSTTLQKYSKTFMRQSRRSINFLFSTFLHGTSGIVFVLVTIKKFLLNLKQDIFKIIYDRCRPRIEAVIINSGT